MPVSRVAWVVEAELSRARTGAPDWGVGRCRRMKVDLLGVPGAVERPSEAVEGAAVREAIQLRSGATHVPDGRVPASHACASHSVVRPDCGFGNARHSRLCALRLDP